MDDVKKRPSFLIRDILGGDGQVTEQHQQQPPPPPLPQRVCRGDDMTAGTSAEAAAVAAAAAAFSSSRHGGLAAGRRDLSTAAAAAALLSASVLRGSDISRQQQQQHQQHHQQHVQFDDQWAARVAPELLFLRTFCSQAATNFTSLLAGRLHHAASLTPPSALQQLQLSPPPLPRQQQQQQKQQQLPAFSPLPLPPQQQPQQPATHVAFLPYGRSSDRVISPLIADETTKSRKCRRSRTVFTESQLLGLEKRFEAQKYLSTPDRVDLASALGLNQLQVKTWYQNRRMKWKKEALQNGELEPPTKIKSRPRQSLSSGTDDECDDDVDAQMAVDDLRDVWK